jgi:hypothetical protein
MQLRLPIRLAMKAHPSSFENMPDCLVRCPFRILSIYSQHRSQSAEMQAEALAVNQPRRQFAPVLEYRSQIARDISSPLQPKSLRLGRVSQFLRSVLNQIEFSDRNG